MFNTIKFIDLFAGIGGMRLGLEQACKSLGIKPECVLTSEIKASAIQVYQDNFQ
jgi:DNA (cytosine-5)-methyltransferase 1